MGQEAPANLPKANRKKCLFEYLSAEYYCVHIVEKSDE
jgi:hypothetical protein